MYIINSVIEHLVTSNIANIALNISFYRLVRRSNQKNYIHINPWPARDSTCNSPLGMIGGKQTINFGEKCSWGNLAHEFMHSLGTTYYIFY